MIAEEPLAQCDFVRRYFTYTQPKIIKNIRNIFRKLKNLNTRVITDRLLQTPASATQALCEGLKSNNAFILSDRGPVSVRVYLLLFFLTGRYHSLTPALYGGSLCQ